MVTKIWNHKTMGICVGRKSNKIIQSYHQWEIVLVWKVVWVLWPSIRNNHCKHQPAMTKPAKLSVINCGKAPVRIMLQRNVSTRAENGKRTKVIPLCKLLLLFRTQIQVRLHPEIFVNRVPSWAVGFPSKISTLPGHDTLQAKTVKMPTEVSVRK